MFDAMIGITCVPFSKESYPGIGVGEDNSRIVDVCDDHAENISVLSLSWSAKISSAIIYSIAKNQPLCAMG